MKTSFAKQLWLSSGIILVSVIAAFIGIYLLSGSTSAQADKIISDRTLIAQQAAVLGSLAKLESDAPHAADYMAAMDMLLPVHDDLISFPQWVTMLAGKYSVTVSFSFTGNNVVATPTAAGSDGFSLNADGTALNLVAFLNDLESHAPGFLLSLDSFSLTSDGPNYAFTSQGRLFSRAQ
jgi:hypothetical protein